MTLDIFPDVLCLKSNIACFDAALTSCRPEHFKLLFFKFACSRLLSRADGATLQNLDQLTKHRKKWVRCLSGYLSTVIQTVMAFDCRNALVCLLLLLVVSCVHCMSRMSRVAPEGWGRVRCHVQAV